MEVSANFYDMQRKTVQLMIDAFLDLEEKEDNQAIDMSSLSGILKLLTSEMNTMTLILKEPNPK